MYDHDHDVQVKRNGVCFTCTRPVARATVENREAPLPAMLPSHDGPEQVTLDGAPSTGRQLGLVWEIMRDGNYHTLAGIALAINMPEASVSARLRDLRKPEHGGWNVTKRRDGHQYSYRVTAPARELASRAS